MQDASSLLPASAASAPTGAGVDPDITSASPSTPSQETTFISQINRRIDYLQNQLDDLDTPAVNAALEVILASVAKPGVRSTEFWLMAGAVLGAFGLAFTGRLSPDITAAITFFTPVIYAIIRAGLKNVAAQVVDKTLKVLAVAICFGALTGCAQLTNRKAQLGAVGEVALAHLARDVKTVAGNALINQASTGFDGNWQASLAAGAFALTPVILSSGNLRDYLDAWNPASPEVNAAIAKSVSALPGDQIAAALQDPVQAQALASQVGVAIGNAILNPAAAK